MSKSHGSHLRGIQGGRRKSDPDQQAVQNLRNQRRDALAIVNASAAFLATVALISGQFSGQGKHNTTRTLPDGATSVSMANSPYSNSDLAEMPTRTITVTDEVGLEQVAREVDPGAYEGPNSNAALSQQLNAFLAERLKHEFMRPGDIIPVPIIEGMGPPPQTPAQP